MSQTITKILILLMRVVCTFAGLTGAYLIFVTPFSTPFVLYHFVAVKPAGVVFLILIGLINFTVAGYFLYAAYLIWFEFSALAVRHFCGICGFCTVLFTITLQRQMSIGQRRLGCLVCLAFVYFAYKVANRYLSQLLFPPSPKPDV
jgi:hypothetical protein